MRKVCYLVSTLRRSGPTSWLLGLIKGLDTPCFEPVILTLSNEETDSLIGEFQNLGVEVRNIGASHRAPIRQLQRQVSYQIDVIKPDLVHSSGIRPDAIAARIRNKVPVCSTVHAYYPEDFSLKFGAIPGTIVAMAAIRNLRKIPRLFFCSKALSEMYSRRWHLTGSSIPNGVDPSSFAIDPTGSRRFQLRSSLGLENEGAVFVFCGSMSRRKRPDMVVSAFMAGAREVDRLVMLGDGPLRESCEAAADARVHFAGQVSNVVDYLACADAFVSASSSEGLPMAAIEAGMSGCYLVLSDIPQHAELVAGSCAGVLVDSSVEGFAEAFRRFSPIGLEGARVERSRFFTSCFSSDAMCRSYMDKYDEILSGSYSYRNNG